MKKRNVLLSSIITIALCLSVIAGSTFALFTDKTEFDISVTSGDVEILATAEIVGVYSAKAFEDGQENDKYLIDEYGKYYYHEEQRASYEKDSNGVITKGVFSNGGDVKFDNSGVLTFNRITPGDRVDVKINIENKSDVAFVYRYKLVSDNTNLATGMVVTIDNTPYESLAVWTSDWKSAILAPEGNGESIPSKTISIELPVYAGNEYQSEYEENNVQSVNYTILVEAVQANAITTNDEQFQIYQSKPVPVADITPVLSDEFTKPESDIVLVDQLYLQGDANVVVEQNVNFVMEYVTADVDGSVVILDQYNPLILIKNCDFILDAGEYIVDASRLGTAYQVFLVNVTVNGVPLVTDADAAPYLQNVGWYQVVDPALWG